MRFRLFRKPQMPVAAPNLPLIQELREEAERLRRRWKARENFFYAVSLFGLVSLGLLLLGVLTSLRDAIGPTYGEITISLAALVFGSFAASLWQAAKCKSVNAWRLFWVAGSLAFATTGWYISPTVQRQRLLKATVIAQVKLDRYQAIADSPDVDRVGMLEAEEAAAVWNTRWDLHARREQRRERGIGVNILCFLLVLPCAACAMGGGYFLRRDGPPAAQVLPPK